MTDFSKLIHKDLINLNNKSKDISEFFEGVSKDLINKGYVESTFLNAIQKREKQYPTGLEMPEITLAIPHTDVEHIKIPFIYINKVNSNNLEFIQMGTDDVYVKPEYVIILGINKPEEQVGLLSSLIELFSSEKFVSNLNNSNSEEEIYNLFIKH